MTTPRAAVSRPVTVVDPGGHLAHQLMLVRTGRKSRAAGIRRCTDCTEPFNDDHTGLPYCGTCRTRHTRRCTDCQQSFPNTEAGDRLCDCCRAQLSLFSTGDTSGTGGAR